MKAKSTSLRETRNSGAKKSPAKVRTRRLPFQERRAQILDKAAELFSNYGLTAQTRALAAECGISQRLLYRFFPTKEELLKEVYDAKIVGSFKASWFAELSDRTKPIDARLRTFYSEYMEAVLNQRWLRLFLYASLAEADIAPNYISTIITKLMETIVAEAAHERGITLDIEPQAVHELGWTLHGAISHYAIRRHIYRANQVVSEQAIIDMHIGVFLSGFEAMARQFQQIKN